MAFLNLVDTDDYRRQRLRAEAGVHGIDYIEVVATPGPDNQRVLKVYFIPKHHDPSLGVLLAQLADLPSMIRIEGGMRIAEIQVMSARIVGSHLEVRVSEPGDYSTYSLVIDHTPSPGSSTPKVDPAYARCDFSFKVDCPTRFDCRASVPLDAGVLGPTPQIDYMAKDYASFRRALLDLLPSILPEWRERHAADLGMTMVELFAFVGDRLSYFQDAVANEAFLDTARQRVSVRRHARLVDYDIDDGASAQTFVHVTVQRETEGDLDTGTVFLGQVPGALGSQRPPHPVVVPAELAEQAATVASTAFESVEPAHLDHRLNRIDIHTWGHRECTVPRGATFVDLTGDLLPVIDVDDYLLLEEVRGSTGDREDANPSRRQVVRVTATEGLTDPLLDTQVTRVHWHADDALTFPLVVASWQYDQPLTALSVARGNLVLADHGLRHRLVHARPPTGRPRPAYRFLLPEAPLGFSRPRPAPGEPAASLFRDRSGPAAPRVDVQVRTEDEGGRPWSSRRHLLDSEPFDEHFTVETDDLGRAWLRFGDGEFGMVLPEGSEATASYTVGVGTGGNIGADAVAHVVRPEAAARTWPAVEAVRNPLPAWGGREPEPLEHVRLMAPATFHSRTFRAVTEADYASVAEEHPAVFRAVAEFRWTGSWYTVFLTIDPRGTSRLDPALQESVKSWVAGFAQTGYDLEIDGPVFVPLDVELSVCAEADHFRADVEQTVSRALGSGVLPDGSRGFFHPDNFTFGQPLYVSRLIAAVEAVPGVDSVTLTRLTRRNLPDPDPERPATQAHLAVGRVDAARLEVIRADSDPSFPENGSVRVQMRGGT